MPPKLPPSPCSYADNGLWGPPGSSAGPWYCQDPAAVVGHSANGAPCVRYWKGVCVGLRATLPDGGQSPLGWREELINPPAGAVQSGCQTLSWTTAGAKLCAKLGYVDTELFTPKEYGPSQKDSGMNDLLLALPKAAYNQTMCLVGKVGAVKLAKSLYSAYETNDWADFIALVGPHTVECGFGPLVALLPNDGAAGAVKQAFAEYGGVAQEAITKITGAPCKCQDPELQPLLSLPHIKAGKECQMSCAELHANLAQALVGTQAELTGAAGRPAGNATGLLLVAALAYAASRKGG